jgi:diguanylate cyclase (GGDEF)-like protein/PAS domain S-box-containing protein
VNDRTVAITGLDRDHWIGRTQSDLGFDETDVEVREGRLREVFESGQRSTFHDEIANLEGCRWYETELFPQHDPDGSVAHVVVVSRDITLRKEAEERLVRAARTDALTGLANRRALVDELTTMIEDGCRDGRAIGVLMIDLDHFKFVNDSLGHAVGDAVLCAAARTLVQRVPPGALVARHGGDEFVVVLPVLADPEDAIAVAEDLLASMRTPVTNPWLDLATTSSIGLTIARLSGSASCDAHDLIREADSAMYTAKSSGRDGVAVFEAALHDDACERFRLATELRGALERGELDIFYQPEVDLDTFEVRAVEALLRWHHHSGETYTAARFIDIAEDTGLIVDIGYWVLDEVCAQVARWKDLPITVRVNLAPRQLIDATLLERFDQAVCRASVDPRRFCVEITETSLLRDTPAVRDNLAGFARRGTAIAIDDFGTGYASLTYLRRYRPDVIKIDRSFVKDIVTDDHDRRLAAALIALAEHLEIDIIAEGVETTQQADLLRRLGCHHAQGFLFSPAVPANLIDSFRAQSTLPVSSAR